MYTIGPMTNNMDELFSALKRSKFRSRFRLGPEEAAYLRVHGMEVIATHARKFISSRLGPENPANDGRQTPMKNHPVFVAQHATATCCRKCLEKWHGIAPGQPLTPTQIEYIVTVIMHWIRCHDK